MRDELYFVNLCRKAVAVFLKDQWFHLGYSRIESHPSSLLHPQLRMRQHLGGLRQMEGP